MTFKSPPPQAAARGSFGEGMFVVPFLALLIVPCVSFTCHSRDSWKIMSDEV